MTKQVRTTKDHVVRVHLTVPPKSTDQEQLFVQCGEIVNPSFLNPLRPNNDLSQTSHCDIKGLSISEVMRIDNMVIQVKFY